ncbi:MAG: hypothetical protein HY778_13085 [Betaproteobacteria bacterium]|nr:hypothetical protein [Betaproteobacteria bacterium]
MEALNCQGDCTELAAQLNHACLCVSLDRARLRRELEGGDATGGVWAMVAEERPNLFATTAVFVGAQHIARMAEIVAALERVIALPGYRQAVLCAAPAVARHPGASGGACLGYDFHLGGAGPRLIEINTNAGGGMLCAALARAQQACCDSVAAVIPGPSGECAAEAAFVEMFRAEWGAMRGALELHTVAVVDDAPREQYMYPEFLLFRDLFERHGMEAVVCDAAELALRDGALWHGARRIDLVYNRLTDFYFDEPRHATLRQAWFDDAAVITPHPRAHALYADKRNLALLCDAAALAAMGVGPVDRSVLAGGIPHTEVVRAQHAEILWSRRRGLFFKPAFGYGSRAAYRGDKLTRRVFDEILGAGYYVVQDLVPPSARRVAQDAATVDLKIDLRNYAYGGQVQLVAARLYQGQTTNFRTPGGGFAPVLTVPCGDDAEGCTC